MAAGYWECDPQRLQSLANEGNVLKWHFPTLGEMKKKGKKIKEMKSFCQDKLKI